MADKLVHCDFCFATPVVREYHAEDFVLGVVDGTRVNSVASWGACKECAELVDAGKAGALAYRGVEEFVKRHSVPEELQQKVAEVIVEAHFGFWDHRIGDGIDYTEEEGTLDG